MRQAIHIFKKDIRYLWREIFAILFAASAFIFLEVRHALRWQDLVMPEGAPGDLAQFLLGLAAWALIARAIHAEALPGDRQFWLTRPYRWKSLLAAKALLILVFVNLPVLLSQALILLAYGFPLWPQLPGLFWTQVLVTSVFVLPIAALAAVTTGFVQLILTLLVLAMSFLAWSLAPLRVDTGAWGPMSWVWFSYAVVVMLLIALAILIWQYSRRKTATTRSVGVAGLALILLGNGLIRWTTAFAIQSHFSKKRVNASALEVGFDSSRRWLARVAGAEGDRVQIDLPLQIAGIPAGMDAKVEGLTVAIEAPDGAAWRSHQPPPLAAISGGQVTFLRETVDGAFYRKVKNDAVKLRGSVYLTLYGARREMGVPFGGSRVTAPGLGICSASHGEERQGDFVLCRYPFRSPPGVISVNFGGFRAMTYREALSYSPLPARFGVSPVSFYFSSSFRLPRPGERDIGPAREATVVSTEPVAYLRRNFEIAGIRLGDFESTPAR